MRKYYLAHKGYTFWLTYSRIIPIRLDKTAVVVSIVEIWRGLDAVDPETEPKFKALHDITGTGRNDRGALDSLQKVLEAVSEEIALDPLTEGIVEIHNRTIAYQRDNRDQKRRPAAKRKPAVDAASRGSKTQDSQPKAASANQGDGNSQARNRNRSRRLGNRSRRQSKPSSS